MIAPTHKTLNLQPLVQATGGTKIGTSSGITGGTTTGPGTKIGPIGPSVGTGPSLTGPGKEPIE